MRFFLCVALASLVLSSHASAVDHFWSKKGTVLFLVVGNEDVGKVGPFEVYSPDHSKRVEMTFTHGTGDGDAIPVAALYVSEKELTLPLDQNWAQVEVLWSSDSQTVA